MKKIITVSLFLFSLAAVAQKQPAQQGKKVKCPVCKKHKTVIHIVYGRPGKELQERAERGEVRLGGCVMAEKNIHYYCVKDKKEF
jgi:hypothetical protein